MSKAIVIGTYGGRENWLRDCLGSLAGYQGHPVITVNVPWELGVIKWVYDNTSLSEFLFLQDTVVVKDYKWIEDIFLPGSVSLCTRPYYMYLGKYTREDLAKVDMPYVRSKRDAVTHEGVWTSWYDEAAESKYLWDLAEVDRFEDRHGRANKVYENDHIIKYKGTWDPSMVPND